MTSTGSCLAGSKGLMRTGGKHRHSDTLKVQSPSKDQEPQATPRPRRPMARPRPYSQVPRDGRRPSVHDLPCEASRSAMGEGRSDRNLYAQVGAARRRNQGGGRASAPTLGSECRVFLIFDRKI